jgi:glycosyltransferase involved in cell wall biosynthesis
MNYTLITACLNSIKTIEKTIDSVLEQECLPKQYIFVDGGSTDGTLELISLKEKLFVSYGIDLLVIHQQSNGGIYEAWNMALNQIDKECSYIFILNSDDWYCEHTINYVLNYFSRNIKTDILCGASKNIGKNGRISTSFNKSLNYFPFLMPIVHPACFVKRSVYFQVGKFNENYRVSGDYDFLYRAYLLAFNINFTNEVLVNRLMGGYADSNKRKARKETYLIGYNHSKIKILPLIAYVVRKIFNR